MQVSASIENGLNRHEVTLATDNSSRQIAIASKAGGFGSSVNGAELLLLSIATCFCNDIYREAAKRNVPVQEVKVVATAEFGAPGEPGSNFQYKAEVQSGADPEAISELIQYVNEIAEVHNTLRKGIAVTLVE